MLDPMPWVFVPRGGYWLWRDTEFEERFRRNPDHFTPRRPPTPKAEESPKKPA